MTQSRTGGGGGRGGRGTEGTAKRRPPESVLVSFQQQTHSPPARTTFPSHQVLTMRGSRPAPSESSPVSSLGQKQSRPQARRPGRRCAAGRAAWCRRSRGTKAGWTSPAAGGGGGRGPASPASRLHRRGDTSQHVPAAGRVRGVRPLPPASPAGRTATRRWWATPYCARGPQSREGPPGPLRLRRLLRAWQLSPQKSVTALALEVVCLSLPVAFADP